MCVEYKYPKCGCMCHDPIVGMEVKHVAPCCYPDDEPDVIESPSGWLGL